MLMFVPVPPDCVHDIASRYHVPSAVIYAMLKVEGGSPGKGVINHDGSVDWGPMQINGRWFQAKRSPVKRAFPGITSYQIETDPCVNTEVGVWILTLRTRRESLWTAVGHYHSFKPTLARNYKNKVVRWYKRILSTWSKEFRRGVQAEPDGVASSNRDEY